MSHTPPPWWISCVPGEDLSHPNFMAEVASGERKTRAFPHKTGDSQKMTQTVSGRPEIVGLYMFEISHLFKLKPTAFQEASRQGKLGEGKVPDSSHVSSKFLFSFFLLIFKLIICQFLIGCLLTWIHRTEKATLVRSHVQIWVEKYMVIICKL